MYVMKKLSLLLIFMLLFMACKTAPKETREPFEPNQKSPNVEIGEVDFQLEKILLPGLRKINAVVLYFPVEDAVCLRWRMDMHTYHMYWSPEGRKLFVSALTQYKEDFQARAFGKNGRKARRKYGTSYGYLSWQMTSFSVLARNETVLDFGYHFADRIPYYTITQRDVEFIDPHSQENYRTLSSMPFYFTRKQADAFTALFDDELLATARAAALTRPIQPDIDIYDDEPEYNDDIDKDDDSDY